MIKVYICSPLRGDYKANQKKAEKYCRLAVLCGCFPIAPHIYLPRFMDDTNPEEREIALKMGLDILDSCDQLWVFMPDGGPSEGMAREIEKANQDKKCVVYFDEVFILTLLKNKRLKTLKRIIKEKCVASLKCLFRRKLLDEQEEKERENEP